MKVSSWDRLFFWVILVLLSCKLIIHFGFVPFSLYVGGSVRIFIEVLLSIFLFSKISSSFPLTNLPITLASKSHFSKICITGFIYFEFTANNILSWDSDNITSYAFIPFSLRGIFSIYISSPNCDLSAISTAADVNPAAPQSCKPFTPR